MMHFSKNFIPLLLNLYDMVEEGDHKLSISRAIKAYIQVSKPEVNCIL